MNRRDLAEQQHLWNARAKDAIAPPTRLICRYYRNEDYARTIQDIPRLLREARANLSAPIPLIHGLFIPRLGEFWWN